MIDRNEQERIEVCAKKFYDKYLEQRKRMTNGKMHEWYERPKITDLVRAP